MADIIGRRPDPEPAERRGPVHSAEETDKSAVESVVLPNAGSKQCGCCHHEHAHIHSHIGAADGGCRAAARPQTHPSDHGHDRDDDNDDNCGCGCDCGCGCPHGESGDENRTPEIIKICVNAALVIAGVVLSALGLEIPALIAYIAGAVSGGYSIFIKGVKSLLRLDINENLLMTISVIAAFFIGEAFEGAMVTLLFGIGEMREDIAVDRSQKRLESLSEIRPDTANLLLGDGTTAETDARQIAVGDVIVIAPFERVPLDGCVIEGEGELDASAITGESLPKTVNAGDTVMSGMMNGPTLLKVRVSAGFRDSAASRILAMVEKASSKKGSTEKLISRFAKIYTPIVAVLAVITAFLAPLLGLGELSDWVHRALVFLVASCPCAIVISVPLCFYAGIGAASKKGILVKGSRFIETVAAADTVVFDKTGTLTEGELSVTQIKCADGISEKALLAAACAAEAYSDHPVAAAIKKSAKERGIATPGAENHEEVPGNGVRAEVSGQVIECSKNIPDGDNDWSDASVVVRINGKTAGAFVIESRLRSDAGQTVESLRQLGIGRIAMLTGDAKLPAEKTAAGCGINDVHASLMPEDKLRKMQEIAQSGTTIFVGDGINDAPVLSFADTGVAMGLGTDAAIENADMVLSFDRLSDLPAAIRLFRRVCRRAKANIAFALLVKLVVLVLAVLGIAPMWLAVFADVGVTLIAVINSALLMRG